MKRLLTIITILFLLSPNVLKATHFAGADLTYTCLGGSTYLVSFTFYRDCSGTSAPSQVGVSFSCSSNSSLNFYTSLQKISGTGQEITQACSAISTHCNNGNAYGIQEYVYQGIVTLAACNSWTIHTNSCCRNTVSTVYNQSSWAMLATLNNLDAPCNSSPIFSNKPIAVVCINQNYHLNFGAVDPDGDSLVYSFYPVMTTGPTSTVNYHSPYTYTNFLASVTPPGITIDSITGKICFTPTMVQSTVYGLKVQEYRNINGTPTLIGTVYRDLQLKVISCNNQIPILSGIDTSLIKSYSPNDTIYEMQLCISKNPIILNIYGFDPDSFNPNISGNPEKFSISWNNGIPTGTFTAYHNTTDHAYAHFSWLPTASDLGKKRCFTATIQDNACPYNSFQTYSYCFLVQGLIVDIGSDISICESESVVVKANADSSTVNYFWKVDGVLAGVPASQDSIIIDSTSYGPGLHTVSIETNDGIPTNTCSGVDQIMVDIVYQPQINGVLCDTTICSFQTVTYNAGPGKQYNWRTLNGTYVGASQTFTTNKGSVYIVRVDGGFNTHCYDIDTFEVINPPTPPPFSFGPDVTIGQTQTLVLRLPTTQSPHYLWSTGDTTSSITIDSSFNWINRIVGLTTFGNQCYSSDTIYVYIGSVGMEEDSDSPLKIYPNPIHNYLNIELQKDYPESNIEILDLNGKLISKTKFSGASYKIKSLNTLPKGVYILHLQNEELNVLLRFVKE